MKAIIILVCFVFIAGAVYFLNDRLPSDVPSLTALAEHGNANAQAALAWRYHLGEGVKEDHAEGDKWYLKAAQGGNALSAAIIADKYRDGADGFPRDLKEAYFWFLLSKKNGSGNRPRLDLALKVMHDQLSPEQIAEVEKRVREWKPPASPSE